MQANTLNELSTQQAQVLAHRIAYRTLQRDWSFAQIDASANRAANGLLSMGLRPGDRVAALTKQTPECIILLLGACKIGAVCMPVNWRLAAPELEFIFSNGAAKMLLCDEQFLELAASTPYAQQMTVVCTQGNDGHAADEANQANEVNDGRRGFLRWLAQFEASTPAYVTAPDETALQLYSSGTTGLPKGVELTHTNLLTCFQELGTEFGLDPRSIMLNTLPTFHISGVGLGLMTYSLGAQSVFHPDFDPRWILRAFGVYRISHVLFVPAMIQMLLNTEGVREADYSMLKQMSYGASPITDAVLIEAMRTFKCEFLQVYGLTETTGAITYLRADDHDPDGPRQYLLRAAGRAGAGVELRVVDSTSASDCADGEVGEVWIRSRQNMAGYWRNAHATAQAFPEGRDASGGWFRSGDAGYLRDGYLFIHDRIKDMIISGGENIYPAELENMLMQHPAIADCAVIGVPDERWGEAVKACVVLRKEHSATSSEIMAFSRDRMAHFKCPKSVDFLDMLPRNPSGKLLKYVLRQPYWVGRERQVN